MHGPLLSSLRARGDEEGSDERRELLAEPCIVVVVCGGGGVDLEIMEQWSGAAP